jgi:hypothetical protein
MQIKRSDYFNSLHIFKYQLYNSFVIWMIIIQIFQLSYFGGMTMNEQYKTENLTIHHKVTDYTAWRKGYDAHEQSRRSAGLTNGRVFRSAEDPNDVVVLQDCADVAKARTWVGSEDLKAAMQKSGVIGSPTIRFAA